MDRAREADRPACPLLVVRLGRNAGCHLVLDITFPRFRMIPRDILKKLVELRGKDLEELSLDTVRMFHRDAIGAGFKL